MNGHKYEHRCAQMLRRKGFHHVEVTKKSGDQGVDIIAYKHFSKYAIQCKYYSYPVGNKAVQEVYAGGKYYDCDRCIVMTNGTFTNLLRNAFPFSQREFLMYYREFCLIFAGILGWLGFGNWGASTLCGALYLFLGFSLKAPVFSGFTVNGINLVFLIPALIYFVHVYFLKPKS